MTKKHSKLSSKVGLDPRESLVLPEEGQRIGKVEKLLGGERLEISFSDGSRTVVRIPGKFRDELLFRTGSYVLLRQILKDSDEHLGILYRYCRDEIDLLSETTVFEEW